MLKSRHVLVFGLILTISTFFFWTFISSEDKGNSEDFLNLINQTINKELELTNKESKKISGLIEENENPSFSNLVSSTKYPYFIYKNKKLLYWSDQKYNFRYENVRGDFKIKFLQLKNGKYLVFKDNLIKGNDFFEVFFLIPLTKEYPVQNHYLHSEINSKIFPVSDLNISDDLDFEHLVFSKDGDFLFSVSSGEVNVLANSMMPFIVLAMSALGILAILLFAVAYSKHLSKNQKTDKGICFLFFTLLTIRGVMLIMNYPFSIVELSLFNSKYFASSSVFPSLGDMFLNISFLFIFLGFVYSHYHKSCLAKKVLKFGPRKRIILTAFLIFLANLSVYIYYTFLVNLYFDSLSSLDITVNIDFDINRVVSIFIFILSSSILFIFTHILARLIISINHNNKMLGFLDGFYIGFLCYVGFAVVFDIFYWSLFIASLLYFSIIIFLRFPKIDFYLRYNTYLYLILAGMLCSVTGAYAIYEVNKKTSTINKQKFASNLLMENDVLGEYLLHEASLKIRQDLFIKNKLLEPFSFKDIIEQKIRKLYLHSYLEKYDLEVYVFNSNGQNYEAGTEFNSYFEAAEKYKKNSFKTEFPGIFYINDPSANGLIKYFSFVDIEKNGFMIGSVLIELKHKRLLPHSVYPELLVDKQWLVPLHSKSFSYAIFNEHDLIFNGGNFSYLNDFPLSLLKNIGIFDDGVILNGHHHYAIASSQNKVIVVSSENYYFKDSFSNFSFLFLILIVFVLLVISFYGAYYKYKKINTTFSTKIQVYLNVAFILPLFIVSFATLSIISSNYKNNLNKSFVKKAENISENISVFLDKYKNEQIKREQIEQVMYEIAQYTDTDILLFSRSGYLIFSNQPMLYESGLFSRLINPKAYLSLLQNSNASSMLNEEIGKLQYNSVYMPVHSPDKKELLGIVSIPFFESKYEIDRQLIEVLTTILNIFTTIFIIFIFISFFVSRVLTYPLTLITQKIRKTNLSGHNEPLEWNSKDEIGLLVGEYNKMLINLEDSREALSKTEKEWAWREMAKQVAHEIKNPLTPMKLTIQHLQRFLKDNSAQAEQATQKALNVLLDQVNNLNEIATSFSVFAKMPIPKNERFEISGILARTAALHNNSEAEITTNIPKGEFYVLGDEQLMGSIFTNLILNGIQSVDGNIKPKIFIRLWVEGTNLLIEFKDNGMGIPDSIKDKIFIPNFSTKFTGSGIGLAVAKRGVEHAAGKIWFETMESTGTSFFIELPLIS